MPMRAPVETPQISHLRMKRLCNPYQISKNKFCLSFLKGFWKTQLDKINDSSVLCENSGIPCVSRVLQFYEKERLKEVLIMWILISYHPLWGSKCIINGAHLRLLSFQQKYCLSACSIYSKPYCMVAVMVQCFSPRDMWTKASEKVGSQYWVPLPWFQEHL